MKIRHTIPLLLTLFLTQASAGTFNPEEFAKLYFSTWTATQSPTAKEEDIEHYLALLADDIGHQHLPYDPDDSRSPDGKQKMREGMSYYLGAHTDYHAILSGISLGYNVIVITYETHSKGVHPQTGEKIEADYQTLEVLEIEDGKVAVIRKYSE